MVNRKDKSYQRGSKVKRSFIFLFIYLVDGGTDIPPKRSGSAKGNNTRSKLFFASLVPLLKSA